LHPDLPPRSLAVLLTLTRQFSPVILPRLLRMPGWYAHVGLHFNLSDAKQSLGMDFLSRHSRPLVAIYRPFPFSTLSPFESACGTQVFVPPLTYMTVFVSPFHPRFEGYSPSSFLSFDSFQSTYRRGQASSPAWLACTRLFFYFDLLPYFMYNNPMAPQIGRSFLLNILVILSFQPQ